MQRGIQNFVDGIDEPGAARWAHIDIAGSMEAETDGPYQRKGMTGRPTRCVPKIGFCLDANRMSLGILGAACRLSSYSGLLLSSHDVWP
jgi:hypothetical protein